ncbi:hypothetical protein SCHPADRAFT_944282 [Schizopora paradoxa]|uniref:Protein kinase domain-containing protein n=1 Tax=Schizopora paradoxa TaxID=27342 RepID=A0A0H2R9V9_9AGAM|nr:hypothetical protein SCHPADRAFT_944282 [Schizopora paradoxa]
MAASSTTTWKSIYADDELEPHEVFWRDIHPFLMDHGYQLRPRFRPGWVPSWKGTNKDSMFFEDSNALVHTKTIDAVRIRDNRNVYLKRVAKGSQEVDINVYLSNPSLRDELDNHAAPLLDIIVGHEEYDFLVMPVLRIFDDPPFVFVDEVLDFVQQTLDGLVFLHQHGVAHRDCSNLNLRFDATAMYPEGFHPYDHFVKRNGIDVIKNHLNRTDVLSAIRYYFTDFGISSRFTGASPPPHLVTGLHCQDKTVPELSDKTPYDPFKTDVYILGNVFKTHLTDVYSNLSFLDPLFYEMTKFGPKSRPSAEKSLSLFHKLVREQMGVSLRWMLLEPGCTRSERVNRHIRSMGREVRRFARKLFGFPSGLILLASVTAFSFVYGPRNVISRIRDTFQRRP